jgi:hypothetical protein
LVHPSEESVSIVIVIMLFSRTVITANRFLASSTRAAAVTSSAVSNSKFNNHQQTNRFLNVASRPSDLIGNTPLLDLNKILVAHGVDGKL